MFTELFSKPILVFGCGNILFGDDGFGPAVIDNLHRHYDVPESVLAVDVGTSIRELLFDLLLAPSKPSSIFIVDAVYQPHREPGELFEVEPHTISSGGLDDFSLHHFPSSGLIQELRQLAGVNVRTLAVQVKRVPDQVRPGISREVETSIPRACRWLLDQIEEVSLPSSAVYEEAS